MKTRLLYILGPVAAAALLAAALPQGAQAAAAPVSLGFVKFNVSDLAKMQTFYETAFGMTQKKRLDFAAMTEVVLTSPNGLDLALVKAKDNKPVAIGTANGPIGFYIKDVTGVYRRAMAAGARSVREPKAGGQFLVGLVQDPEGHEIEILDAN